MGINVRLVKVDVDRAFNAAITSDVRNDITIGGVRGTASGGTPSNALRGDLPEPASSSPADAGAPARSLGHRMASREQGAAPGRAGDRGQVPAGAGKLDLPPASSGERVHGDLAAARDRARAELQEKPWLNEKAMHIFAGENPDPQASTALWESAINRMAVRGTTLEQELRRVRECGYYTGYRGSVDPRTRATLAASRDRALNYSNVSGYATDNSSGGLAAREAVSGSFQPRSTYNREHFFAPGSAEPAWRNAWRRIVAQSEAAKTAAHPPVPEAMRQTDENAP